MLEYLSEDISCSEKRTVLKTVRLKEQRMSADKYPSIFSRQMEAIVFIILQVFFATRAILQIEACHSDIQSRDAFRPIERERKYLMDYNYKNIKSTQRSPGKPTRLLKHLRACLHGGGGPQVGEVTRLAVVEKWPAFTCKLTTPGSRGDFT